jgi:hypothetical protein
VRKRALVPTAVPGWARAAVSAFTLPRRRPPFESQRERQRELGYAFPLGQAGHEPTSLIARLIVVPAPELALAQD